MNSKKEITFIGTSHIDPEGYSNLIEALNTLHPEIILLEVSPLSVILRRTYGYILGLILRRNLKILKLNINPEIRNIAGYLSLPYEYMAVRDYCRRTGVKFILADSSIFTLIRFIHAYKLVVSVKLTGNFDHINR